MVKGLTKTSSFESCIKGKVCKCVSGWSELKLQIDGKFNL